MDLTPVTPGSLTITPAGSSDAVVRNDSDLTISADHDASGAGNLILKTGGVERARVDAAGVFTGLSSAVHPPRLPAHSVKMISAFQSGHGWTSTGNGSVELNDTTNYVLGSQGISLATAGAGSAKLIKKTGMSAIDLSASQVVVWLKCPDITNLSYIDIYCGDTTFTNHFYNLFFDATQQPIAPITSDEWVKVTIPRDGWTESGSPAWNNITDIQMRVTDDNTGNPVTVYFGGIGYTPDSSAFPNGVVSITFDDGRSTQFTEGRKKMDAYGFPGTAYVIVDLIGTSGFMTAAQLTELEAMHGWEIAAHAYTQANHDANYRNLTAAQVANEASKMKAWLVDNGYRGHNHFAYPGGGWNLEVEEVLGRHYQSLRLLTNTPRQSIPPWDAHRLQCFQVLRTTTTAAIQALIDDAYAKKSWLVLLFHGIVTTPSLTTEYSIANFGTVIDYVNTKGIPVRTVGDVLASL